MERLRIHRDGPVRLAGSLAQTGGTKESLWGRQRLEASHPEPAPFVTRAHTDLSTLAMITDQLVG